MYSCFAYHFVSACIYNIICMYVCPSRLGMLIFFIRCAPAILELDVTHVATLLLLEAGHIKLHEHKNDR